MVILPNRTRYDHRVKSNEALDVNKKPKRGEWFFSSRIKYKTALKITHFIFTHTRSWHPSIYIYNFQTTKRQLELHICHTCFLIPFLPFLPVLYDVVLLKKKKEIFKPETATGRKRSTPLCYAKKSLFSGRNFQKNKSKR